MPTPSLAQSDNATMKGFTSGNYRWEIDTGYATGGPVNWVEIRGHFGNPMLFAQITEDDTDAGSNAWTSKFPTGNGWTAALKGLAKGTGTAPNRVLDPGLAALLRAGRTVGDAAIVHVRCWRTDEIEDAYEGYATCKSTLSDGKPPKLQEWSADLEGRGEPTTFTPPTAAGTQTRTITLNGATSFTPAFSGVAPASQTSSVTAAALQTAIQALDGLSAVTVTGTAGGPYTVANIPNSVAPTIVSSNGLATFA